MIGVARKNNPLYAMHPRTAVLKYVVFATDDLVEALGNNMRINNYSVALHRALSQAKAFLQEPSATPVHGPLVELTNKVQPMGSKSRSPSQKGVAKASPSSCGRPQDGAGQAGHPKWIPKQVKMEQQPGAAQPPDAAQPPGAAQPPAEHHSHQENDTSRSSGTAARAAPVPPQGRPQSPQLLGHQRCTRRTRRGAPGGDQRRSHSAQSPRDRLIGAAEVHTSSYEEINEPPCGPTSSDLGISPFDVTAEHMEQWWRFHRYPRAPFIEAKLKSRVGARQSSQPATRATHTRATRELSEEAVLTYRRECSYTLAERLNAWEVEMHARFTRLTSSISIDGCREDDASTSNGQKQRKIHKHLSAAADGIPPPLLQMQT